MLQSQLICRSIVCSWFLLFIIRSFSSTFLSLFFFVSSLSLSLSFSSFCSLSQFIFIELSLFGFAVVISLFGWLSSLNRPRIYIFYQVIRFNLFNNKTIQLMHNEQHRTICVRMKDIFGWFTLVSDAMSVIVCVKNWIEITQEWIMISMGLINFDQLNISWNGILNEIDPHWHSF